VGSDTSTTTPSSYNEFKKFAGFLGFVTKSSSGGGNPIVGASVKIYGPTGALLSTQTTDVDGYYMFAYKHTAKSAQYRLVLVKDVARGIVNDMTVYVTVKANGFAAVNYEVP